MTEAAFRTKRRQQFLTEQYFKLNDEYLPKAIEWEKEGISKTIADGVFDSSSHGGVFKEKLNLLRLHYTAGDPIELLRTLYAEAMRWFDEWHQAYRRQIADLAKETGSELRTDGTPIRFEDLSHFQLVMDVTSLGILLGDSQAVRHAASWLKRYRGTDMVFESLIEPFVNDPRNDVEEFFHSSPYDPLLDAIYTAETPEQACAFVKQYLEGWYKSFEGVPWHDGHLVKKAHQMPYYGYWAFEAAAVCVIHGIDDTSFRDHVVYPKDLADWARANGVMARLAPGGGDAGAGAARLTCQAGEPCPREGFWFTPAKAGSRRLFKLGDTMPELKTDYGLTIWQWDEDQSG